ncbi:MAG: hypothetical protein K2H37_12735 [Lachnospiraceae bacterium]|nr:hypothetical protein [Lachnospiraceae bacterium]
MVDADGEENPDNSDTTEGETNPEEGDAFEEIPGDNDTPVIDPADDVEAPAPDGQEEPVEGTDAAITADGDAETVSEYNVTDGTEDKTGYDIDLGEGKATADADFTFKVTAKTHYAVSAVKYTVGTDSTEKEATKGEADENGAVTYTIDKSNITADITIKVTAAKIKYTITVNKTDADSVLEFSTVPNADAGIESGESLTFTAKLKEDNKETHKISKLSYQVGGGDEVTPTASADGTYTITNVSGNVVINVEAVKIPNYTVTFAKNSNVAKVTDIKINGTAAEKNELGDSDSTWAIEAKEGFGVSFKLEAAEFFKVIKVADADGNELKAAADGTYTIASLDADKTLTMTAELDETQCYAFTFAMAEGSDEASATATISMPDGVTDQDGIVGTKEDGDKVVSRNEKVVLTFTAATGYQIDDESIKAAGATIKKVEEPSGQAMVETSAKYELTMIKGTPATVTVGTDAIGSGAENTVAFKLEGVKNLTLGDVKVDGTAVTAADGKYAVAKGAKRVAFVINAAGPYAPKVVNKANKEIEAKIDRNGDNATYTYTVLASALAADGEEFTVTEEAVTKAVTLAGDTENVNTVVSMNGKVLKAESLNAIPQGQTVTVKVTQKDNCALTAVSYKVGETAGPAVKVTKGAAEFSVKVTDDVEITVTANGLYKAADLKDKENKTVEPVKNIYSVSYDASYTAGIVQGADNTPVAISKAELLDGARAVAAAEGKTEVVTVAGTTATINLLNAAAVAGKKLTLKLYATEGEGEDAKEVLGATYTLQVSKEISTISVPASAKQPTDTVKGYKVTTNGEIGKLVIAVQNSSAEGVVVGTPAFDSKTGLLMIQTGQTAGTAEVVISNGGTVSKTIKVESTALISARTAKPTVKLKSASDIDLTLTLGAKKIEKPEKGAVLYEVKVTPAAGADRPEKLLETVATQYFVKDGDTQDVTIRVARDKITVDGVESEVTYGDGGAWKYDVEVALVHVKDKTVDITAANIDSNLIKDARSQAFATGAKPFATQTPAWEVNLKLKKGTTTVYTGQENVMVATPQFTKTTTYTEIQNSDIVDITYKGDEGLTNLEIKDGKIYASATEKTAVGKHTVQVTAKAANTMYASRATVVVTVVRGIDTLGVTVPSESIFKAVKKAATLKAVAYYNGDKTGKDKTAAPKTKKVTWEIVKNKSGDAFAPADPLYGMVTINKSNGTVTVNKDYVVAAEETDNQFVIKATVDNGVNGSKFIGKAEAAYSEVITITNVGADLSTVAIVKPVYGEETTTPTPPDTSEPETTAEVLKGYKVVAIADGKNAVAVEASAVTGGYVKAFTAEAGLEKNKEYTAEELAEVTVPNTDVSYKSSSAKNVAVGTNGKISVVKPAKAKLTVTANDGSKAKAEISLNVTFDSTENKELALKISKAVPGANGTWTADTKVLCDPASPATGTIVYNGSAVSRLVAEVMVPKDGGGYEPAPAYANYDVKITGGKKTQQQYNTALLTSDKQEFKITLTDKSQSPAKTVEYSFKNSDVLTGSKITKIAAKALNTLHPVGTNADQKVQIELSKIPETLVTDATAENGKLAAAVEVDWNKLNDKNRADLTAFATDLSPASYEITGYDKDTKKGAIELTFNSANPKFSQSSYALKVTVGSLNNGVFTALTAPAAATVKVDKVKKFTFKPTTSYTIGLKDAGAVLTGKSSIPADDLDLSFTKLLNANIKGVENKFTSNFDINKDGMLIIKAGVTDPTKIDKNDLTGYLVYSATTQKDYYDNKGAVDQIVKITVKIKDAASTVKYGISESLTLENRVGAATQPFKIMAGDKKVEIAGNFMVATKNVWISPSMNENDEIILTLGRELPKSTKSFPATIYFAPKGSRYESIFDNGGKLMTDKQWEDNLKFAASVKVTVRVTPAETVPPQDMTVAEVKTAVAAWAKSINDAPNKPDWLIAQDATETSVETAMLAAIKKAVNATDAVAYTIDEQDGKKAIKLTLAQVGTAGSLEATIKITKGEESDTQAVTLVIPALANEQPEQPEQPEQKEITETLKNAISDAVKAAATGESATITITSTTGWDDVSAAVLAAAGSANGVSPDFEVVAAESDQLKINTGASTATIKVVVRQKDLTTNSAVITIEGIAVTTETTPES